METKILSGYLRLKSDGNWYIGDDQISNNLIYSILKNHNWMMIYIEESSESFSCFPILPILSEEKLTITVDL